MLSRPLSKTALQQGAQCPRMLWIKYNMPSSTDSNDNNDQEQFEIGNIIGQAARKYFNDGKTVMINTDRGFDPSNYNLYAQETINAMNDSEVATIAEATFYTGELIVFIDLLHRNENGGWDIYEVKSTNRVSPTHAQDAAWQTYVARTLCDVDIKNTYLMHPRSGWSNIASKSHTDKNDFEIVDMFSDWIRTQSVSTETAECIAYLSSMVKKPEPPACACEPGRGECCCSPYRCNFVNRCRILNS